MRKLLVVAALVALLVPVEASASVLLGVEGSKSRFRDQTNQATDVNLDFISWGVHKQTYLDNTLEAAKPIPAISFGTVNKYGNEAITPAGLANGKGDRVLIDLARALDRFGSFAYIRPYAEMNGYWNPYSAYNSNGTYRGRAHSTKNLRKAFRRTYLIVHGGSLADINAKLVDAGMPKLDRTNDLPENDVKVIWNPQGFGSPDIKANSAAAYYPGDNYVDIVANDLYDYGRGVEWEANLDLYRAHPDKPYAIGEWGLGPGIDHPDFVQKMANFVSSHSRVETIVYYRSQTGSTFDLSNKPKSRAAYKRYIIPLGK
ncbi:MAG TPA: hypothetical protein VK273_09325 [Gaiellaceae bacterium]|nr:hypothetical protein [Gaiellaceae bacterium]